ncbi:hypothetical protein ACGFXC_37490 [Streptomyces sp. NPDC048507]|uniref:hypothetical protein n=1 Tax=Streptomyces sp. NPDC048507 TaxID=3365560 RepID=UPI003717D592
MNKTTLLVLLLLAAVAMMALGAVFYVAHRYPRLATPLMVTAAFAAVFVALIAGVAAL